MSRVDVDPLASWHPDPSAGRTAAGEHKRMQPVLLDDRELEVAIIRRRCNALPYRLLVHRLHLAGVASSWNHRDSPKTLRQLKSSLAARG